MSEALSRNAAKGFSDKADHNNVKTRSYEPVRWNEYFNIRDDIQLEVGTFRIYRRGVEGPLLFLIHGGGFSALTWAVFSTMITDHVKCQCLAVDMRGHGDTVCQNDDDLSIETLSKDVIKIIFAMYPTEAPPIILVGHSMGGAVAVHVACKRTIPSLAGLVVIDVVEGSALSSLNGMVGFLRSRPNTFATLAEAIEWSVRSSQLRNLDSARVSFPGQLKHIGTGRTATSRMEQDAASCVNSTSSQAPVLLNHNQSGHRLVENLVLKEEEEEEQGEEPAPQQSSAPQGEGYTWRIDLVRTQPYWQQWFSGLSRMFLSIPEPKLLLLAGVDRLDKELTIGQMQGKFQLQVFPNSGHAVHEDAPDKVADCLAKFLVRNRFTEARSNCEL